MAWKVSLNTLGLGRILCIRPLLDQKNGPDVF